MVVVAVLLKIIFCILIEEW